MSGTGAGEERGGRGSSGEGTGPSRWRVSTARGGLPRRASPPVRCSGHTLPAQPAVPPPPPCVRGTCSSQASLSSSSGLPCPPALASRIPRAQWTEKVPHPHHELTPVLGDGWGRRYPQGNASSRWTHACGERARQDLSFLGLPVFSERGRFQEAAGKSQPAPSGRLRDGNTGGQSPTCTLQRGRDASPPPSLGLRHRTSAPAAPAARP